MEQLPPWIYFVVSIFVLILAVLWFLLPFAIFGTKSKLDEIRSEIRDTNNKLQFIVDELKKKELQENRQALVE
jgi:hypothetical protein